MAKRGRPKGPRKIVMFVNVTAGFREYIQYLQEQRGVTGATIVRDAVKTYGTLAELYDKGVTQLIGTTREGKEIVFPIIYPRG